MALRQPPSRGLASSQQETGFPMARTIGALVMREMSSTYGKSTGGYLWVILEPIAGIVLLTVIFSIALLATVEVLRRRGERLRGLTPA